MSSKTDRLPICWEWGLEVLDDEETVEIKEILTSLAEGKIIPSVAAERLDNFIVNFTNTHLATVEKRQSMTLTPEEKRTRDKSLRNWA
jgi:hypothetical protein